MDLGEQLRILQAADGDPARLALATVDLAFPREEEPVRAELKEALAAAAIPHWCDEALLAALLQIPLERSRALLTQLVQLTCIEPFPARGEGAINVHEKTRRVLRKWMATEELERFRRLSGRVADALTEEDEPAARIEWIYHRLGYQPEVAAGELEQLNREWSSVAHPEDHYALAGALAELERDGLVAGRAWLWCRLVTTVVRQLRGEHAQLHEFAGEALAMARSLGDAGAEAESACLLGDAMQAQGDLSEAQQAFAEYLSISRRLAEQDPGNAGWQRDLAVAHSRVGGVLEAQGKLAEAQQAFGEDLSISRRLAEQDPGNVGWQWDLAVAHGRVGDVLQARGKLAEAQQAFGEVLSISRRLAELDPGNAGWQRELAVAHSRVGGVLQAQGKLAEAQQAFDEVLSISRRLAEQDPGNAGWRYELAVACVSVARLAARDGDYREVVRLYQEAAEILAGLVAATPAHARWRRDWEIVEADLKVFRGTVERGSPLP
ncbi:tetratricopeptide repeat protein [Endothiovibrio diazotrophicus]